jgi:hypothetical protein
LRDCFREVFTGEGIRVPVPYHWIAELHEMDACARKLSRLLAEARTARKPRIRSKWERTLGALTAASFPVLQYLGSLGP